jgi:hypothetical protein
MSKKWPQSGGELRPLFRLPRDKVSIRSSPSDPGGIRSPNEMTPAHARALEPSLGANDAVVSEP